MHAVDFRTVTIIQSLFTTRFAKWLVFTAK